MSHHKVVAIVPSAGLGRRFGVERNKPFETLGGKPVLIWGLEALQGMAEVSEIIPVLKESDMAAGRELFGRYGITKVLQVAQGGRERQDSVYSGLQLIHDSRAIVLVHDGARPFLDPAVLRRGLQALPGHDGIVIAVPPKDTIKEIAGGLISRTLTRDSLVAVQTPQIFFADVLRAAYEKAMQTSCYATDDAALVELNGGRIGMVQGDYTNIKITTPEDLVIAEAFLAMKRRG